MAEKGYGEIKAEQKFFQVILINSASKFSIALVQAKASPKASKGWSKRNKTLR